MWTVKVFLFGRGGVGAVCVLWTVKVFNLGVGVCDKGRGP